MKRLQFDYNMKIGYSEPVNLCRFTLKCFPMEDARQHIISCCTELIPQASFAEGRDSFGNALIFGSIEKPHNLFSVRVAGEIELLQTKYEAAAEDEPYLYRYPKGMSSAGERIKDYFEAINQTLPKGVFEKAVALMHRIHCDFKYEKGCTDANTSAEMAFSQGCGVCQDYAHIYIAMCHLARIPARYVTGLLVGEGESHAWVEVLADGRWIGLDVTNDTVVSDAHIKFGNGRDASDCRLNTGIVFGQARQTQSVSATAGFITQ